MKKFTLAIFYDYTLESGGNFQQSLNNIFLAKKLESTEINIKIITTEKDNKNILKNYDYVFLGAWNFKKEIINKEKKFFKKGLKFITHIPYPRILG